MKFLPFLLVFMAYLFEYAFHFFPNTLFDPFPFADKQIYLQEYVYYATIEIKYIGFIGMIWMFSRQYKSFWLALFCFQSAHAISYFLNYTRSFILIGDGIGMAHILPFSALVIFAIIFIKETFG